MLLLRATAEGMCADGNSDVVVGSLKNWAISATTKYALPLDRMAENYTFAMNIISRSMPEVVPELSKVILINCNNRVFLRHVLTNSTNDVEKLYSTMALLGMAEERLNDVSSVFKEIAK